MSEEVTKEELRCAFSDADVDNYFNRFKHLTAQNAAMRRKAKTRRKSLQNMQRCIEANTRWREAMLKTIGQPRSEYADALARLEAVIQRERSRLEAAEKEIASLETRISQQALEHRLRQDKLEEAEQKIDQRELRVEQLEQKIRLLEYAIESNAAQAKADQDARDRRAAIPG